MKKVSTAAVKATKNFSQPKLTIGLDAHGTRPNRGDGLRIVFCTTIEESGWNEGLERSQRSSTTLCDGVQTLAGRDLE
jgi:hypothetical protein